MKVYILMAVFAAASQAQLLPQNIPGASPTAAPPAAGPVKPDTVVATVAGVSVTQGDVAQLMKYAPPNLLQLFQQNPQQALGTIYQLKYLQSEAEKQHLDQKADNKEKMEAVLAWQKMYMMAEAMVNEIDNGYNVSQQEVEEFFKGHQARYEEAKIKIILIGFKPAPLPGTIGKDKSPDDAIKEQAETLMQREHPLNERSEAEARTLADNLVKQLRAGADFAALVEKYSDDKESKASGGDFGIPIKATSSFAPEIKKVVFDLKKGEISDPLRQANSYYIIRLEDMTLPPVSEVSGSIAAELRSSHRDQVLNDLNKRFLPQMVRPDFFIQMQHAAQAPAAQNQSGQNQPAK